MNRTFAIFIVLALAWFAVASQIYAQVFAQAAAPAATPPSVQPRAVNPPAVAPPPQQVPYVVGRGAGQGGQSFYYYNPGAGPFFSGEDDPELSELTKSEHELSHQADELMREYGSSEDNQKRDSVKKQLRELLAKQFDVQRQRREHELAKVEERLRKLREQLRKRNDARETIIDRRLEHLVTDAEGLGWTPPAGDGARPGGLFGPARTPVGAGGRR